MLKTIFSRTFSVGFLVGKVAVFLVGLAVVLGLMLAAVATAAEAAKVKSLKLGIQNTVSAVTTMTGGLSEPVLRLVNTAGHTALDLQVQGGEPPLTVNPEAGTATDLSADELDGNDSSAFLPSAIYQVDLQNTTGADTPPVNPQFTEAVAICDSGDKLLSGGFGDIDAGTQLIASFPSVNAWVVRWKNDGTADTISVHAVCADLAPLRTS